MPAEVVQDLLAQVVVVVIAVWACTGLAADGVHYPVLGRGGISCSCCGNWSSPLMPGPLAD